MGKVKPDLAGAYVSKVGGVAYYIKDGVIINTISNSNTCIGICRNSSRKHLLFRSGIISRIITGIILLIRKEKRWIFFENIRYFTLSLLSE